MGAERWILDRFNKVENGLHGLILTADRAGAAGRSCFRSDTASSQQRCPPALHLKRGGHRSAPIREAFCFAQAVLRFGLLHARQSKFTTLALLSSPLTPVRRT